MSAREGNKIADVLFEPGGVCGLDGLTWSCVVGGSGRDAEVLVPVGTEVLVLDGALAKDAWGRWVGVYEERRAA